jgi:glycosyltransferase involved in cell wall biosynthesis
LVEGCLSPKFSTNQFQKRNQKGIKKVVTIGRISPDKGQQTIAEVSKHFPDIEFTIIGQSSKQDKKYENQIRQISGKNVVFVGSKDNHQTLSKEDWDLAIIPSKWEEPFGLTPLETMSSSILTITSNNGNFVNFKKDLGTITYSNLDELIQILNQLTTAKTSKLQEKAMEQYQQATQKYSYQIFQQKLKAAVLKPE